MRCGVRVDPELVIGMLSRFPRSSGRLINYAAFLQYVASLGSFRYGLS
jgi:hypothetical protein